MKIPPKLSPARPGTLGSLVAGAAVVTGCWINPSTITGAQSLPHDQYDPIGDQRWTPPARPVPPRAPCSPATVANVLTQATAQDSAVMLDCNLTLQKTDVVSKRLVLEGEGSSGVSVDCQGATLDGAGTVNAGKDMLEIRSRALGGQAGWEPVHDASVARCNINGSVRLIGMAKNGEGADLRASSRSYGHATRAREAAPTGISLLELRITANGRIPLYLAPGVNNVRLENSQITGTSTSVAVYLDAESHGNTLKGNSFGVATESREVLAIDASSYNTIVDNHFSGLGNGGIFLYRNCGEGGTIRHTTPSHNVVVNNVFYYDKYDGSRPAVYLGSRDGKRGYCDDDRGFAFGSSASDHDHARFNVVMQNQIYKLAVADMIKTGNSTNKTNFVGHNETVSTAVTRQAGCYLPNGVGKDFIADGDVDPSDSLRCNDGALEPKK